MMKILTFLRRPVYDNILKCASKNIRNITHEENLDFTNYVELNQDILMAIEKV